MTFKSDLNPVEMLWVELRQQFFWKKSTNIADLKLFCLEQFAWL